MVNYSKLSKLHKAIIIAAVSLVLIFTFVLGGSYFYIKKMVSGIKTVAISKDPLALGIAQNMRSEVNSNQTGKNLTTPSGVSGVTTTSGAAKPNDKAEKDLYAYTALYNDTSPNTITNILVLGVDSRDPDSSKGRADSIMIVTIDKKNTKLKLTSILRDSYVTMDGHSSQKLTNSHAYGGPLFTIRTINQNYNMDIKNYVQVNFYGLAKIIDYIGGIPIDVKADEVRFANKNIKEMAGYEKLNSPLIAKAGLQNLSGIQAVGYSRIRYTGNSDFERTSRQRTVITEIFNKLSGLSITRIPKILQDMLPYVETSLNSEEIMNFASYILFHRIKNIEQSRVPYSDLFQYKKINGASVIVWNKKPTIERLHNFIFKDIVN